MGFGLFTTRVVLTVKVYRGSVGPVLGRQSIIRGHGLQVVSDVKYSGVERSATKQTENNRPQARKLLYTPSKPIGPSSATPLLLNTAERAEA